MNFPDLPHLMQLQKDLWQWPKSRASVMVGAGFSLNADPLPGVNSRFPTWRQLVRAMFDELHPSQPGETPEQAKAREARFNSANALRIASEYEAAFERRKLDLLIRAKNPDSEHQPGKLHHLLLQLPWADVFTTNYDTLLERTEIHGRTYQPVTKASELTTAFAPRIVKLHGSFPSQTPFIISEEDYRTYPRDFAPFVNTVQQSLLENSFVLFGFSGDDPNFLEWTGWIRDELHGKHAPIYLVGLLSLGNAERSLLARRGVTPIDLSAVFAGISPQGGVHAAAIEWFLNCLYAARPPRPEKWPKMEQDSVSALASVPNIFPPIAGLGLTVPKNVERSPSHQTPLDTGAVSEAMARWQFERLRYPGWVIAADGKRSELWGSTKYWLTPLANFAKDWSAVDRVLFFREINWRLETAMVPLFPESIEPFNKACDELFNSLAEGQALRPSLNFGPTECASSAEVADAWLEIAFGLLREARETYHIARWRELKAKIDIVVQRTQQHVDRNLYESALWAMWNVDRQSAKTIISSWQPSPLFPRAQMWKAGLLAELDEPGEAKTILRTALLEIRRALRSQGQNIELLSLEGWCTYLLFAVETSLDFTKRSAVRDEFWERWQELKAWDCSPWPIKEQLDLMLSSSPPKPHQEEQEVRGFDPGRVSVSRHWTSDPMERYLPGFACIRLYEAVGIPMRLPMLNISGDALKNACHWVAPFIGFWSPALLIRAGKFDDLIKGDFLNRTQVAAMEIDLARRLYLWCLEILERELSSLAGRIARNSSQESLLKVLPEVLSRLAFKVDAEELKRTFPLVLHFHRQPVVRANINLHDSCDPWFKRLFDSANIELLLGWLPDIIRMPLFDEDVRSAMPEDRTWPDPMAHFPSWRAWKAKESHENLIPKIEEATDWLLRRAASESGEGWRRAIYRLINIHSATLMTTEQQQQLAELLWSQRAPNNLPDLPGFAAFGFLHLPAPAGVDVLFFVKNHLLTLLPIGAVSRDENGRTTISGGGSPIPPLISEISLASKPIIQLAGEAEGKIEWTPEEAKCLYDKAREWWANDKEAFERDTGFGLFGHMDVLTTAKELGQFLARTILPRMERADENDWQQLLEWLQDLRNFGIYPSMALPYILLYRPSEAESISDALTADANADAPDAVSTSARAMRHWIHLSAIGRVSAPPPLLLTTLIDRVIFRRKPSINSCLQQLSYLISERPEAITPLQAASLTASLIPWHHATILPMSDQIVGDFYEAERPDLRALIGTLAGVLKTWHTSTSPDAPEPTAITMWRDACESDPLPEIQRAFAQGSVLGT